MAIAAHCCIACLLCLALRNQLTLIKYMTCDLAGEDMCLICFVATATLLRTAAHCSASLLSSED
jgi:hypothetical protein